MRAAASKSDKTNDLKIGWSLYVPTTEMQARIEELADKCTEGRLTPEEREEYEAMIRVGNFVAILQAKARRLLAGGRISEGSEAGKEADSAAS